MIVANKNADVSLQNKVSRLNAQIPSGQNFTEFVLEQYFKLTDLHIDDLSLGITDGGEDNGIDACYVFADDRQVSEVEETFKQASSKPLLQKKLNIIFFQIKEKPSFSETAVKLVESFLNRFTNSQDDLSDGVNSKLKEQVSFFRDLEKNYMRPHPDEIGVQFIYIAPGIKQNANPNVLNSLERCKSTMEDSSFISSKYYENLKCELWGIDEILYASEKKKNYDIRLPYKEFMTSTDGYVLLVPLENLYTAVTEEDIIQEHLFSLNVRDFLGTVEVNKDISTRLHSKMPLDFWCYNNGITIICDDATSTSDKVMNVKNLQIVNGLQTTYSIVNSFESMDQNNKTASVLVKIIKSSSDSSQTKDVIKSTNKQTSLPPAVFTMQEQIHSTIEDYLKSFDLFYETRTNYYKNQNVNPAKIIAPVALAQAYNAVLVKEPHNSRRSPQSLFTNKEKYNKVFDEKTKVEVYLSLVNLYKRIDSLIPQTTYWTTRKADIKNLKFHVYLFLALKFNITTNEQLQIFDYLSITIKDIENCISDVLSIVDQHLVEEKTKNQTLSILDIAKKNELTKLILDYFPRANS
jgi:hypothetical protein